MTSDQPVPPNERRKVTSKEANAIRHMLREQELLGYAPAKIDDLFEAVGIDITHPIHGLIERGELVSIATHSTIQIKRLRDGKVTTYPLAFAAPTPAEDWPAPEPQYSVISGVEGHVYLQAPSSLNPDKDIPIFRKLQVEHNIRVLKKRTGPDYIHPDYKPDNQEGWRTT